jgi:hypothetical protein
MFNNSHRVETEDYDIIKFDDDNVFYYLKGTLTYHRTDGPAIILPGGKKEWWLRGIKRKCSSQEEFEQLMRLKAFW